MFHDRVHGSTRRTRSRRESHIFSVERTNLIHIFNRLGDSTCRDLCTMALAQLEEIKTTIRNCQSNFPSTSLAALGTPLVFTYRLVTCFSVYLIVG